jgi:hypothetical protein
MKHYFVHLPYANKKGKKTAKKEMRSCYVVQTGLELLGSHNYPPSASSIPGTTGTCNCTWLEIIQK